MKNLYKIALMIIMLLSSVQSFSQTSGAISGTVTDENMNPIKGAIITVNNTSHTATSDENGSYLITGVEPSVYDILANTDGYQPEYKSDQEVISGETTIVDFILTALPGSLEGIVRDSLYNFPIEGAYVDVFDTRNDMKTLYTCVTDENGYYYFSDLDPRIWNLTAIYYDEYYLFSTSLEVLSGQSAYLDIQLVSIAPFLIGATPGIEEIYLEWYHQPVAKTNHFNFEGGIGSEPVWTIYIGGATFGGVDLVAGDEIAIFDGETIVGVFELTQVCTPDNQFDNALFAFNTLISGPGYTPGNAYSFKAWNENFQSEYDVFDITLSDPYGGAWMEDVFPPGEGQYSMAEFEFNQWIIPYQYNVYYEDGTLVAANVAHIYFIDTELIAGQEYCYYVTNILYNGEESLPSNILCAIPLSNPPGAISGTVTDNNMNPIEGTIITVNNTSHTAISGEDGTYVITDIEPGVYDIVAEAEGYNTEYKFDQEVISGETTIVDFFLLPLSCSIYGYVIDSVSNIPLEGATVYNSNGYYISITDMFGYFILGGIEPGVGELSVACYGYYPYSTTIELLPGQSINLNIYLTKIASILLSATPGIEEITLTWEPVPEAPREGIKTGHFNFVGGDPDYPFWSIYIGVALFDSVDLEAGDEIGIFDGDLLVGAFTLYQVCTSDNQFDNVLYAFSVLANGEQGYTSGNSFTFVAWDESSNIESFSFEYVFSDCYCNAWTSDVFPWDYGEYSLAELTFQSNVQVFNIYYEDETLIAEGIEGNIFTDTELISGQEYCYYVTQILDNGTESFASNILCATPLSSNATQSYNLVTGYQFISTRIIPENSDMLSVFEDILNDNLDFVRNSQGQTLRKIGSVWVNGIGDWIIEEGYLVKMFNEDSFSIEGVAIDPTNPISLEAGYQFVSYFPETPMNVLEAFETIISDDLDFIRNSQGQTLRKIGPNWINGIGDCQPTEGYLVKMFADDILIYPIIFGVPCPGIPTVTYEGQVYNTVLIGNQCWFKENLNIGPMLYSYLNQTNNNIIEKYCYDDNPANCDEYGGLYQWDEMMQYTTIQGEQGICPAGWHIPTDDEWKILEGTVDSQYPVGDPIWNNIGFRGYDTGINLKSTNGWNDNGNGSDAFGFTALPGGGLTSDGNFYFLGFGGNIWSSTESNTNGVWSRLLHCNEDGVGRYDNIKFNGFSVRCLMDNGRSPFDNLSEQKNKNTFPDHFIFEGGNPADPVFTIYTEGFEIGDEIAAFDGDILVGALRICFNDAFENELPVFSTINSGKGYIPRNPIILKVWDKSENAEYILNDYLFSNPYGDAWTENVFPVEDGEYSLLHFSTTGISDENKMNQAISIYPNPSEGIFNISIEGVIGKVQIKVFDIHGNDYRLFEIDGTKNITTKQLDLKELAAGIYFISFSGKNLNQVRKIVIQ
jgi:uncharacterized protein (TIGR02145 family)